jgi:hypothetical protein
MVCSFAHHVKAPCSMLMAVEAVRKASGTVVEESGSLAIDVHRACMTSPPYLSLSRV